MCPAADPVQRQRRQAGIHILCLLYLLPNCWFAVQQEHHFLFYLQHPGQLQYSLEEGSLFYIYQGLLRRLEAMCQG